MEKCGRRYRFVRTISEELSERCEGVVQNKSNRYWCRRRCCAPVWCLLSLSAIPFSRWWVWVAVYRSLDTGFECNIYHGLAHKMRFVPFFFRKIFTCKTPQDTTSTDNATIIRIQTTKIPKQYSDIKKGTTEQRSKTFSFTQIPKWTKLFNFKVKLYWTCLKISDNIHQRCNYRIPIDGTTNTNPTQTWNLYINSFSAAIRSLRSFDK